MTSISQPLLIAGILFTAIGVFALIFQKKKLRGLIPLTIGACGILVTTVGPLSRSRQHINQIITVKRNEVYKVSILPSESPNFKQRTFTKNIIETQERNIIDSLFFALKEAEETSSVLKNPTWVCLIHISKTDSSFLEFQLLSWGKEFYIEAYSNGEQGWIYGTLKANHFGKIVSNLSK